VFETVQDTVIRMWRESNMSLFSVSCRYLGTFVYNLSILADAILTFRMVQRSRILRMSEFCVHMVNYICTYKGVPFKRTPQHPGTWSAAAWRSRHLCYRPAVFFGYLSLTALAFPRGKIRRPYQKCCYFNFLVHLKGVCLKLCNLKPRKSRSVCTWAINFA